MQDFPKNERGRVYTIGRETKQPFLTHGKVEKLFLHLNVSLQFIVSSGVGRQLHEERKGLHACIFTIAQVTLFHTTDKQQSLTLQRRGEMRIFCTQLNEVLPPLYILYLVLVKPCFVTTYHIIYIYIYNIYQLIKPVAREQTQYHNINKS